MKSIITFFLCWSLPFLCLGGPIQSRHAAVAKIKAAPGGGGGGTRWITNASGLNSTSSSYSGYIGGKFTVGGANITVTHLARYVISGSTQTHTLKIWDDSGTDVILASASLDASLFSNEWGSASVGTPVVLTSGVTYRIGSEEFSGGDLWHEAAGSTYTVTGVATLNGYNYGNPFVDAGTTSANNIYCPVSFIYSAP